MENCDCLLCLVVYSVFCVIVLCCNSCSLGYCISWFWCLFIVLVLWWFMFLYGASVLVRCLLLFLYCVCALSLFIFLVLCYPNWGFFRAFSSVVRQMSGFTRKDGARPALPELYSLCIVCIVRCKCVVWCCHRVSTQLRLNKYHIIYIALELASSVMTHDINDNKLILPSYDKYFRVSTLNFKAIKYWVLLARSLAR